MKLVKLVTSWDSGLDFVVSVLWISSKVGSSRLDLPTSGATWSPRCTSLSLPPSTSCRPISPGSWLSLTQQWWGGPHLTWEQGQLSASQQGVATLKSRPVIEIDLGTFLQTSRPNRGSWVLYYGDLERPLESERVWRIHQHFEPFRKLSDRNMYSLSESYLPGL